MASHDSDSEFSVPSDQFPGQPEPVVYDFSVDLDDPYSLQSRSNRPDWKKIGLISGGTFGLLLLAFVAIVVLAPNIFLSHPIRTTMAYYEFLNEENYSAAFDLLEPGTRSILQFQSDLERMIETFACWDIPYEWDFIEMKYHASQKDDLTYLVQVDGYIRIIDIQTERHLDLPFSDQLTLVKQNDHLYIRP
jgi:hypothetical protein